jgi:putative ABC transport system permease protein
MRSLLARVRLFWRGARRPAQLDADMQDEMRFHIEMETRRLQQRGVDADEAARQAGVAFGGVEKYRGAGRDALGLTWLRGLSTDLKLGTRMLRKYPGLTVVGVLALSLAIGAGAAYLEFVNDMYRPTLSFADGARLVGLQNRDIRTGVVDDRGTWDFVSWRSALTSIEEIGAYAALDRNLITDDGRSEIVKGVAISASAFRMLRVPPLVGRPLVESDERAGAAPVAVIGYDLWQARFAGDQAVIGRTIKLGTTTHTIVGVMPAGFAFPISHDLWAPLRLDEVTPRRRDGVPIKVFGLLAPGVRLSEAQAELASLGARAAADFPDTHQHMRPQVKGYVAALWTAQSDGDAAAFILYAVNLFFVGLLAVCGANIATLVFARTATRATELNVRTALGASRARIAGQLFAEALVLCSLAAGVGLLVAYFGLMWVKRSVFVAQGLRPMFWWNDQLSFETIAYTVALAVIGALIIGVIPAWKATGAQVQDGLKQANGVRSDMKFGGVWTGVIVSQVGLTVVFLCIVGTLAWGVYAGNAGKKQLAFPGREFIAVRVGMDGDVTADTSFRHRFRDTYDELARRLRTEPGVTGVTFATHPPGTGGWEIQVEVAGLDAHAGPDGGPYIRTTQIDIDLPQVFGMPVVSGRGFTLADTAENRNVAIVDQTFVRHVLGGADAVGHQVRRMADGDVPAGPWLEIVGVMPDLSAEGNKSSDSAILYRPITAGATFPLNMAIHVSGDPTMLMPRLRAIAATVDPTLRLENVQTFERLAAADRVAMDLFTRIGAGIAATALLLAMAGVYALMSFTVARRTPEIAIRLALGANANRVVLATFSRALLQVALGVAVGCIPGGALVAAMEPEVINGAHLATTMSICGTVVAFMTGLTLLASYGPARRALRIQPTDALKAD